jgi:hypothetical protein
VERQEPIGKGREITDRIDRGDRLEDESPAERLISRRSIRGRYLWERSVKPRSRVIIAVNTDRKISCI